ncbi:hypothetical protein HZP59_08700 [Elizabethkingia anophelis]|nr:hypothetical protein [Elizabethkingia anophelis]
MITIADLQKEYLQPINKGFKKDIEKFISDAKVQTWVKKAMKGKLTDKEVTEIYKVGKKGGQMPNLYWLLCIYIHPLTTTAFIFKKIA